MSEEEFKTIDEKVEEFLDKKVNSDFITLSEIVAKILEEEAEKNLEPYAE